MTLIRLAGTLFMATLVVSKLLQLGGVAGGGSESWLTTASGVAYLVASCLALAGLIQHVRQRRAARASRSAR